MYKTLLFFTSLLPGLLASAIQWSTPTQHDFETVTRGRPVSRVFVFTNVGDTPLTVETVRTTCGCTATEWPQYPILPDSTGRIKVTYDTRKKGDFRKMIKVYFYEIREAEKLYIQGRVN